MPTDHSSSPEEVLRPSWMLVGNQLLSGMELCISAGVITAIRPSSLPLNLPGRLLMPGFVNAHSHAFQRGIRGHVQHAVGQDDFWSWRERMYKLASTLSPEGLQAVSALAYLEMIQAGFTSVGEFHYVHHQPNGQPYDSRTELAQRVFAAGDEVGLRVCLLRVAYARAGAGQEALPEQIRFCDSDMDAVLEDIATLAQQEESRFSVGLAAHSVRALRLEHLRALARYDGVVHAHVDEQPSEIEQCLAEHGCRPLEIFEQAGLLTDRFAAVHFTHPNAQEIELLHRRGAKVVACPTTEMDLGDGFLPIEALSGVSISIGTDSHVRIDPLAELRALEWHARARLGRRCVTRKSEDPEALAMGLLHHGTRAGAEALDLNTGVLEVGTAADLIAIDCDVTPLCSGPLATNWVFSGQPSFVRELWVEGEQLLWDGRHLNEEAIRAAAMPYLEK